MSLNWRGFFSTLLTGDASTSASNVASSAPSAIATQPDLSLEDVHGEQVGSLMSTDVSKIRLFSEDDNFI